MVSPLNKLDNWNDHNDQTTRSGESLLFDISDNDNFNDKIDVLSAFENATMIEENSNNSPDEPSSSDSSTSSSLSSLNSKSSSSSSSTSKKYKQKGRQYSRLVSDNKICSQALGMHWIWRNWI